MQTYFHFQVDRLGEDLVRHVDLLFFCYQSAVTKKKIMFVSFVSPSTIYPVFV